ncbi:hypothetical protein M3699_07520 [Peribacillus simplex]|uniref:hypothetical protein n=1 Tax=Peribacillus simplex TaxID=1478 RepID=UPI00203E1EEC|nr:hypothetical protein [Peribacillus simplex]MCM3673736.1 hypothetical protein [Peribacillus simplex]
MKSIKTKVLVAFSLIISLFVILGAFNIYSSNKSLVYSQDMKRNFRFLSKTKSCYIT